MIKLKILLLPLFFTIITSCSHYSFMGNSLPKHLKTIQISLIKDQTGRYDLQLAEKIRNKLKEKIEDYRILELSESNQSSDSYLEGSVTKYSEIIVSQKENEVAEEREIKISFTFTFFDKIAKESIVKKAIINEKDTYLNSDSDEVFDEKIETLIDKICEDTIIKLSSNW